MPYIKPCPFCGSEGKIVELPSGLFFGSCVNPCCICQVRCEITYEKALGAWNTRTEIEEVKED